MKYLLKKERNPGTSPDEDEDEGEQEEQEGGGAGVEHSSLRRDEAASGAVLPISLVLTVFKYNCKV
jgi:hypothetical protein